MKPMSAGSLGLHPGQAVTLQLVAPRQDNTVAGTEGAMVQLAQRLVVDGRVNGEGDDVPGVHVLSMPELLLGR
jgi:hypothetical protein